MTLPTFVGSAFADGGATSGATYTTDFTALSLQDGDYLLWVLMMESNTITLTTAPAGWTLRYNAPTVGSRSVLVYDKVWHTGDAKTAAYVKSGAFSDGNQVSAWRGVDPSGTRIYGTGKTRAGSPADTSTQTTALGITTTVADTKVVLVGTEATSAAESGAFLTGPTIPSGWTQDAYKAQGTTIQTIVVAHKDMATAGASGNATLTYQNTQASNAWGVQIGLPGVVASNTPPTASFTHSESNLTTTVNGSGSSDADGTIASWDWNWGDATAHGSGASTSHTYAAPGTYTVTLTVTDNGGATATTSASVTVAYATATVKIIDTPGHANTGLLWKVGASNTKLPVQLRKVGAGAGSPSAALAKSGFVFGHMGTSYDEVEGSLEGITRALMWGVDGLMLSLQRTSDGVFFLLNDVQYLDRMTLGADTGTTLNPQAMTWAQVAGYDQGSYWTKRATSTPRRPYVRLTDVLAAYPTVAPIMIDPKTISSTYYSAILDLMDANGGPSRFIAKYYITGTGWRDAAKARGYLTWGYGYGANMGVSENWTTLAPGWDWLGLDIGTSQANWNTALAFGKPVIGHIATSKAMYDTGISKGASGIMASGVAEVKGITFS